MIWKSMAVIMLAALAGCVAHGPLVIAERGKTSAYAVRIPENASPCLRHSAEEFVKYVKAMTGCELVMTSGKHDGPEVVLKSGNGPIGDDSFAFRADGRDFAIEGGNDRAVLFGVYDFLEHQCGCEWLAIDQEIVPAKERIEIAEGFRLDRKPAFEVRDNSFLDVITNADYAAKMKLNGYRHAGLWEDIHGGVDTARLIDPNCFHHTVMKLLPPKIHMKDHPEYYALWKGERGHFVEDEVAPNKRVNLCLTNPDVVKIVTSNLLNHIRKAYPKYKVFCVAQSDCWEYCTCPKCAAVDEREESHAGTNIEFVNKVAEAVEKEFPDVKIGTLAYEYTRQPPKHIKPRRNVWIDLCTDVCDRSKPMEVSKFLHKGHGGTARPFIEDLKGWSQISEQVYVWDYGMNFRYLFHAFPNIYTIKADYAAFRRLGVTQLGVEGCGRIKSHQAGEALKRYLIPHLLWDPDQPLSVLLDRFYTNYYGAAAPWMRRYMEELHAMSAERNEVTHPLMMWGRYNSSALKDAFFEKGAEYYAKAAELVKDDPVRARNVRWERNNNDLTRIMRDQTVGKLVKGEKVDLSTPRMQELVSAAKRIREDWAMDKMSAVTGEDREGIRLLHERVEALAKSR